MSEGSDAETRGFLQERIALLFKTMFWSLTALVGFLAAMYWADENNAPDARFTVYGLCAVGLAAMGAIWRIVLVRRPVGMRTLHALDLVYSLGIGTAFGASAYLQWDLRASGYLSAIYTTFTVFARALIVPSSGRRTLVASSLTFVPMTMAAAALALEHPQDIPGPMFFVGYLLFCVIAVALSAYGSNIIYGLRRDVSAAEQLGQYTLARKIGEGGMGAVYLAHHVLLRRDTAIKRILPDKVGAENVERFEREVQHMSQLTHPNAVAVYDYGSTPDGVFYYAMEYLGGGIDLENLVRKYGPQPSGRVAQILAQACGALHEAHTKKLIHRDIKPPNIILCERGGMPDVAKVVDFGLVKDFAANTGASTQVVLGTPAYIAPEAVTDPSSVGPAVDLYAIGCTGYFLLTGKRVFEGKTAVDVCIQHVTKAPTPPSEVTDQAIDPALEAIIMKCLAKQPADRYADAGELRVALRSVPAKDWTDADARAWWKNYREIEQQVMAAPQAATMTMTIDLDAHRVAPEHVKNA
ncbi:MAG TPA: serine/threonine-protein kinase [Kofleriaceae bacterium]|nr:serine/threonine-protein kinase [Kofleriaceae bacterium]